MVYIGIDPGKKGGFAVIDGDNAMTYPWDDTEFVEFCRTISLENSEPIVACVEKVGAMPKQGGVSMFNFGKSAGFIEGVLSAFKIGYQLIPPQRWKKEFGLNSDKQKSIDVCKQLFPNIELRRTERCTTDSDGMGEALLMALYAKRKF